MKLSDCGQADGVLAHTDDWTLDDADETSKLVCEFWMKKSFISKRYKTSEAYRKIRTNKPKESSKVNTRPGVQRYAPSPETVPAVEDIWLS